jgi:hypothetical protein
MSTKADLLTAWCRWTGDPVREARHRIRALSEADLLPSRAHPLSYEDLARALLGFVAAAQHKDAPEAVRKFSAARCGAASAENQEVSLMGMSLLEAVTAALQSPFWIAGFTVNTSSGFCHLTVVNGWLAVDWDGTKVTVPGSMAEYWFKDYAALALPATVHPLELSRAIHSPLIDHLLTDLMNHPAPPIAGAAVTRSADPPARESGPTKASRRHAHARAERSVVSRAPTLLRVCVPPQPARSPPCPIESPSG